MGPRREEAQPQAPQLPARRRHRWRSRRGREPRKRLTERRRARRLNGSTTPRTIDESIEVDVPVSTAYNQWTQFEDFPLFMEGVEHVEQIDDTRLHWVAKVGGKTNEWDAKILEQHPDKQISWISEDGKKTRGTVSFEPVGEDKTRITPVDELSGRRPDGALGSAVGLDARRISGDLRAVQGTDREPRRRERRLARRSLSRPEEVSSVLLGSRGLASAWPHLFTGSSPE